MDLEIEENHNYLIRFYDDSIIAHNYDPYIDPIPWLPASKESYQNDGFQSYGGGYYVEYSPSKPSEINSMANGKYGFYEVKVNFPGYSLVTDAQV